MAKVNLPINRGSPISDLPPVCMKCGAPATIRKNKQFSWYPSWVAVLLLAGVWPYVIVALLLTKRQTVETPLCEQHKSYWWLYPMLMLFALLGLLGFGFIAMIAMNSSKGQGGEMLSGLMCGGTLLGLLVLLIAAAVMNSMRIRPAEITDRYVRLTSVSQEFADAVEEDEHRQRSAFDREDDFPREPRRRVREDDDERYTR